MSTDGSDWWRSAVIYQIYPRSFQDSNGDGIGDLRGVLSRLDHVVELGVDAIWLSPFFRSPMKDFGYDISDYCAVDPIFGTLEDFRELLAACHRAGVRVLIDQVWNHTSDQHPWFRESRRDRHNPRADWYVWADPGPDGGPPNNWQATFGGSAWEWEPRRQQYYLHNFLADQPDLNWYNEAVVAAILDCARFWLDLGVDGFRLDVINFLTHDRQLRDNPLRPAEAPRPAGAAADDPYFRYINRYNLCRDSTLDLLPRIRDLLDRYSAVALVEISCAEDALAASSDYVRGSERLHMAYNASLITEEALSGARVDALIRRVEALFDDGVLCWTGGTHDFPRLSSRWRRHRPPDPFLHDAFDHLFAALLVTLRGSCCIYQGDELGLTQAEIPRELLRDPFGIHGYPKVPGRDGSRTPMPWDADAPGCGFSSADAPWLPISAEHRTQAVARQERDPQSLLNKYRRLVHWRREQPALRAGRLQPLEFPGELSGFLREHPQQRLLCLFNFGLDALYASLEAFPGCEPVAGLGFAERDYRGTVELPPYGVFLAELPPAGG